MNTDARRRYFFRYISIEGFDRCGCGAGGAVAAGRIFLVESNSTVALPSPESFKAVVASDGAFSGFRFDGDSEARRF